MSKKPTLKEALQRIKELETKVQYLVDYTSWDNPDGGFTFPNGDFWPLSEAGKKEYKRQVERMKETMSSVDTDAMEYLHRKIDKELKPVYDAIRPQIQYDQSGEPYAEYDDDR